MQGDDFGSRILVTGANGFVGRALVADLVRRGERVTAATRSTAAFPDEVRAVRIGNLGPDTDWSEALANCEIVVHCAARVHVMNDTAVDPTAEYQMANVQGTRALARQAAAANVKRFVFLSSVKVNGERTWPGKPFTHRDPPARMDPYGTSKADAEEALQAVARAASMEYTIVRPALVYGPGVRANFLAMSQWVARGIPLPLGAVTANRRAFVAIDNLLNLLAIVLRHPSAANQVFLASDGDDMSTVTLLRRTADALGVRVRLVPVPMWALSLGAIVLRKPELVRRLVHSLELDISNARKRLGWKPPIAVDEGLRRTFSRTDTYG
jgi:nucleoside-diphosphate-sugar epimerase